MLALAEAIRRVSPDSVHLADSLSFSGQFTDTEMASPEFDRQVAAAVRARSGPTAAEHQAEEGTAARKRRASGQWTIEDVEHSTPAEFTAALDRGQLASLGVAAHKQRPEPPSASLRMPSAAQARRWKSMPPWLAQRERARWAQQVRETEGWTTLEPSPEPAAPSASQPNGPRRLTNAELLARAARRIQLTPDYDGEITTEDCTIADPQVVSAWMERGKLVKLGAAPNHRGGAPGTAA